MRILFLIAFIAINSIGFGQKPILDTNCLNNWGKVKFGKICNNGNYASYNVVYDNDFSKNTLVVKSTTDNWEKSIKQGTDLEFSADSKFCIYGSTNQKGISILHLGSDYTEYLDSVQKYGLLPSGLIFLQRHGNSSEFHLRDSKKKINYTINNILDYLLLPNKENVLLIERMTDDSIRLVLYSLLKHNYKNIWEGLFPQNIVFDDMGNQIAFFIEDKGCITIYYYDLNSGQIKVVLNNDNLKIGKDFKITGIRSFTKDSKGILFILERIYESSTLDEKSDYPINLEIWNYKDRELLNENYLNKMKGKRKYLAYKQLSGNYVNKIEDDTSKLINQSKDFGIIEVKSTQLNSDFDWNLKYRSKYFYYSFTTGYKRELNCDYPIISDGGNYLFYFSPEGNDFFIEDIKSGDVRNVTSKIPKSSSWGPYYNDNVSVKPISLIETWWLDNDNILLIHDQYDLWQIDPTGIKNPINLTNFYGYKNTIRFDILRNLPSNARNGDKLMLSAFNRINKENGFFNITLGEAKDPVKMIMAPYLYFSYKEVSNSGELPIKAKDKNLWLVKRMDASESPNYYITKDFIQFKSISKYYPERSYNWVKSELYTFKDSIGNSIQGILYKPENFDPKYKYPAILYYYEKLSNNLHVFYPPEASIGPINIPWFVSHGYIVFTPDIHYKIGAIGESALRSVIGAANVLSKEPFIDSTKMAIQGHSLGGFETNYIVTHSNKFAAACTASGVADMISEFGTVSPDGIIFQEKVELGQYRFGTSLWNNPAIYIDNSPVFHLNRVTTPLLIMHTSDDSGVMLPQAVELFTGLRRLRKRAWLLIYHNENHIIWNRNAAIDYTIRVEQFFDYYLKGKLPPIWMIGEGSIKNKGLISNNLELDSTNEIP